MDIVKLKEIAAAARSLDAKRLNYDTKTLAAFAVTAPKFPKQAEWLAVKSGKMAVSPDCSFGLVRECLRKAKSSLKIYIYNLAAPYLLDELKAAKGRGVKVRVMYDRHDSGEKEKAALVDLGVDFIAAPSVKPGNAFTVCHQKFVIVDDVGVLVESANWAGSAIPNREPADKYKMGNREWFVWVSSTPVAAWFDELFEHDWKLSKKGGLGAVALLPESILPGGMMAFAAVPATEFDVQSLKACKVFPVISPDNYQQVLASHLQNAERSICIQQQYITAGEGVNDLLAILEKKKKAGIKIRILVSPKFPEYWNLSVKTLTAANLDSSLRASNLKYIIHNHNKGVLIDDRYSLVSSTNWSENSITRARETGLMIDSEEASAYYQSVFDFDWRVGLEPNTLVKAFALVAQADMV